MDRLPAATPAAPAAAAPLRRLLDRYPRLRRIKFDFDFFRRAAAGAGGARQARARVDLVRAWLRHAPHEARARILSLEFAGIPGGVLTDADWVYFLSRCPALAEVDLTAVRTVPEDTVALLRRGFRANAELRTLRMRRFPEWQLRRDPLAEIALPHLEPQKAGSGDGSGPPPPPPPPLAELQYCDFRLGPRWAAALTSLEGTLESLDLRGCASRAGGGDGAAPAPFSDPALAQVLAGSLPRLASLDISETPAGILTLRAAARKSALRELRANHLRGALAAGPTAGGHGGGGSIFPSLEVLECDSEAVAPDLDRLVFDLLLAWGARQPVPRPLDPSSSVLRASAAGPRHELWALLRANAKLAADASAAALHTGLAKSEAAVIRLGGICYNLT